MRRVVGLSLVGLGTFLIVIAVVLPTYIVGQVIKFPLNEFETATLVANNASYFDANTLTEKSPVTMDATYTIKGDAPAGDSSTAVWNEFSSVYDVTNGYQVELQSRTFAFNRRTAALVQCCGESLNGQPDVQTGVLGYVFPIGTKKQTYMVFDTSLGKPAPFVYSGTTSVLGVQADVFVENVPPTQVSTVSVPGSLIGSTASSVAAPEYYSNHLVYDVDPVTGALINVNEHEVQALYNPATNTQALTLFNADLVMTPTSEKTVVGLDNNGKTELSLLTLILPIVLGVVGAIVLVIGILMMRTRRDDVEAGPTTPAPEQAAVPEEPTRANLIPGLDDEPQEPTAESEPAAETESAAVEEAPAAEEAHAEEAPAAEEAPVEEAPVAEGSAEEEPAAAEEAPAASTAEDATAETETAAAPAAAETDPAPAAAETPAAPAAANGGAPAAAAPKRARRARTTKPAADPEASAK
jgi:hypothetical protein